MIKRSPVSYKIEALENQLGTIKLLLLLYENGNLYFNELADLGMNDSTIKKARDVLIKNNLIEIYSKENSRRIYHSLTENGKRVAQHLLEIEKILKEKE